MHLLFLRKIAPCVLAMILLSGCASVSVSHVEWIKDRSPAPHKIYVRPFTIENSKFRVDRSGEGLEEFEKKFTEDFAERLAERLSKYVRPTVIISSDQKINNPGAWIVEGHFKRVNQGSRALRMLVGLGLGGTKMETNVDIFAGEKNTQWKRIARIETTGGSNAEPGALLSSPFAAGPRLIVNGTGAGLSADARRTTRTITAAISEKLTAQGDQLNGRPLRAKPLGGLPE